MLLICPKAVAKRLAWVSTAGLPFWSGCANKARPGLESGLPSAIYVDHHPAFQLDIALKPGVQERTDKAIDLVDYYAQVVLFAC